MNPVEIEMNFPAEHGGNVFGQFDAYMKKIEKTLHVSLILRNVLEHSRQSIMRSP